MRLRRIGPSVDPRPAGRRLRVLAVSWVFPNHVQPVHGPFVLARMRALAKHADIRVLAPIPWIPLGHRLSPATRPSVEPVETVEGLTTYHPRYLQLPYGPHAPDALAYYLAIRRLAERIRSDFPFDLIDAHFVYPDGTAAEMLGGALNIPVVITLRGVLAPFIRRRSIRPRILRGLEGATRILSVSQSLKDTAVAHGTPERKITVASNGVDADRFRPIPRAEARREVGITTDGPVLISVGHLTPRKGFHRLIGLLPRLLERIPDLLLVIVGGGTYMVKERGRLERLAGDLGVGDHVSFAGSQPNDRVPTWLSAADVFCLWTLGEGWANVFLEAMACGLPVVTTRRGGNPEVVASDAVGYLVDHDDSDAMLERLTEALRREWDGVAIRDYALAHSWDRTAETVLSVWHDAIEDGISRGSRPGTGTGSATADPS
ncbi:MAG: glycosyltransferase [Gemmatimonadota bacterium]|nr:glycosyltransferase [Gemmatimonadota bacterium]